MMDAHGRYKELETTRQPYLDRARTCSSITIPSLYPEEGTEDDALRVPEQGLGARAVKNLASKLLLGLFPPNQAFFRLSIVDEDLNAQIKAGEKAEIEKDLMTYERIVRSSLDKKYLRLKLYQILRLLIVGGNSLLYKHKEGFKAYKLDTYVVSRFPSGKIDDLIIRETLPKTSIPEGIDQSTGVEQPSDGKSVYIYTVVKHHETKMDVHQEIEGQLVPDSERTYPNEKAPFVCLRMNAIDGEDYGRSYVEEHIGDLYNYEKLSGSVNKITAAIARLIWLVNPNSSTNISNLNKAKDGEFVSGRKDDIEALLVDKNADLQAMENRGLRLEDSIKKSFMLMEAIQRAGERVTAEEIRRLAGDLDVTLGGTYSLLAEELQLPIVRIVLDEATKSKAVEKLPKGIEPIVVTGIDAMGKAAELTKLSSFLEQIMPLGQEVIKEYVDVEGYMTRVAVATNLDTEGLIRKQKDVEASRQAQAQQQSAQDVAGNVLK